MARAPVPPALVSAVIDLTSFVDVLDDEQAAFLINAVPNLPEYDRAATDLIENLNRLVEHSPENVAAVSIWMGMLKTDRTKRVMDQDPAKYAPFWEIAETPEFTGHLIAALYRDPKRMEKSGQVLVGAEAALEYGLKDEGGKQPPSHRDFLGGPVQAHPAVVE